MAPPRANRVRFAPLRGPRRGCLWCATSRAPSSPLSPPLPPPSHPAVLGRELGGFDFDLCFRWVKHGRGVERVAATGRAYANDDSPPLHFPLPLVVRSNASLSAGAGGAALPKAHKTGTTICGVTYEVRRGR